MDRRLLAAGDPGVLYPQVGLARTFTALGRYVDAEPLLSDAVVQCERSEAARRPHWRYVAEASIELYEAWHAAEPGQGHDQQAAEWRAKLAEGQASTQPATQPAAP